MDKADDPVANFSLTILERFLLGVVLAGSVSAQPLPSTLATRNHDASTIHSFPSQTPTSLAELLRADPGEAAVTLTGHLFLPEGPGPFPAVIFLHGSAGLYTAALEFWPQALNRAGIAVFTLDLYTPRGARAQADHPAAVPIAADVADAFSALKALATHPLIDSGRISLMGVSRGGSAALLASTEAVIQARLGPHTLRFASTLLLYTAGCAGPLRLKVEPGIFSRQPILFVHGDEDDYTPITPCLDYADKIRASGTPVWFETLQGARHKFDSDDPGRHHYRNVTTLKAECPIELDIRTLQSFDRFSGARLTGEIFRRAREACQARGGSVEGGWRARSKAAEVIIRFLRSPP